MQETKLFPIELPKYFSTKEIQIIKKVFRRYMEDGFLLWPAMLNFGYFMVCLNNFRPAINCTYEKGKVTRIKKVNLVEILNFSNVNVILSSKNKISTDVYYKNTNTHSYLPTTVLIQTCKKNVPYNLAKRSFVFVTDPEKVGLRLTELRIWLKNNKYPDDIISNAFYNTKLQSPAPKLKQNFNNIPFVTSFHGDTDNKFIIKNIKRKIENTPSDYIKGIFKESNIFLPQR